MASIHEYLSPANRSDAQCCSDLKSGLQLQLEQQERSRSGEYPEYDEARWQAERKVTDRYHQILGSATVDLGHYEK